MLRAAILRRLPPTDGQAQVSTIARALHRRLPDRISGPGTLYLWPRSGRPAAQTVEAFKVTRRGYEQIEQSCLRAPLDEGEVQPCLAELAIALGENEAHETRALFMPGALPPQLPDFARMSTLHALDVLARSGWLLDQIAEGRFTSWFHPIADARDTSKIFGHEALLRGIERDGSLISPLPIFSLAREAGLLREVDTAACRSAIREASRAAQDGCVFINFAPAAHTSLSGILGAIDESGLSRQRVVFEVVEADKLGDAEGLARVLHAYREAGLRVALDDLGAGWSTLNLVHTLKPDFIKLDRELVRGVHRDPVKGVIAEKLLEMGSALGIGTIVEGVEEQAELEWVRAHGANYVQGFLLGKPKPAVHSNPPETQA